MKITNGKDAVNLTCVSDGEVRLLALALDALAHNEEVEGGIPGKERGGAYRRLAHQLRTVTQWKTDGKELILTRWGTGPADSFQVRAEPNHPT